MPFSSTNTILAAVKTALEAVTLPEPFTGPLAFERVEIFDLVDPLAAFEEMLVFKARAAFIVLEGVEHENQIQSALMHTGRTLSVSILVSDRNWSNRQKAMSGDATTPGALLLADSVTAALTGNPATGLVAFPGAGELFRLEGDKRENLPARICFRQGFQFHAGFTRTILPRGFVA